MTGSPSPALDKHIRRALAELIRAQHSPVTVIDELPLFRDGRADVAAVNGSMYGYEIKSGNDSLARLPRQIPLYEAVFDYCYIVVAKVHLRRVRAAVPRSWGIIEVLEGESLGFRQLREAKRNNKVDVDAISRLMWKTEIIKTLLVGGVKARSTEPVRDLWKKMHLLPKLAVMNAARVSLTARAAARSAD